MSHNHHIQDDEVEIAARRMHDADPEVRQLAGLVLRLAQNRAPLGFPELFRRPVQVPPMVPNRLLPPPPRDPLVNALGKGDELWPWPPISRLGQ